jgi:hypothetical protein
MCLEPVLHAEAFPSSFVLAFQGLLFLENKMPMIAFIGFKKQTLFEKATSMQPHPC